MDNIIEVENLEKNYGGIKAVDKLSFYVPRGSLFSLLGPNGAGKSTTINILCTLLCFDSGSITVNGYDLKKQAGKIRNNIGIVFQENMLDELLTVEENLRIRAGFYMHGRAKIAEAVKNAEKLCGVTEFAGQKYGKLSGGQRRRADIARALVNTPEILFLDEPTTGLDPQTRKAVWDTINTLRREKGVTVFLTTHYMEEAAKSDYALVVDKGVKSAAGTPGELKEKYTSDILRMCCADTENVMKILNGINADISSQNADEITVRLPKTMEALDILRQCREYIYSFEVVKGTMDDAFINIVKKGLS